MRLVTALILMVFMGQPVLALSCIRPDVARTFKRLDQVPEPYFIVKGKVDFDVRKLPNRKGTNNTPPKVTKIKGHMTGKFLGWNGFERDFDQPVTLIVDCFGPWCGSLDPKDTVLAFARRSASGYSVRLDPCGGDVFVNPDKKTLRRAQQCLRGNNCNPKD